MCNGQGRILHTGRPGAKSASRLQLPVGQGFYPGSPPDASPRSQRDERESIVTAWRKDFYTLFQEIGLPAVRIRPGTAEVIDFNELFASLVKVATPLDYRH